MTYDFTLTDGTALITLQPLESNGYQAQSVPRQILDVSFDTPNAFIVADDVTVRFIAGFSFDVIVGPFQGTYTVDISGPTYDGVTKRTTIPVTVPIIASPYQIVAVTTGLNGAWEVVGAANGDCVWYPGSSFTVAGNSDGPSNGAYTVQSAEVSGSYSIAAVTPGAPGFASWTIVGNVTNFFVPTKLFKITGGSNPGAGTYTVFSAVFGGVNTVVTVVEAIVAGNATGIATPAPAITRIVVTGTIPVTAASDGTASVPPSVAYTFSSPPTTPTLVTTNTYQMIWHLVGNEASVFVAGCPVLVKGNSIFDNITMIVVSAVNSGPNTDLTVQFRYSTDATLLFPDATGTLTHPLPPLPYGYIQYDLFPLATSLELVGRGSPFFNNAISWGQALQDNTIHILENFSNTTPPAAPLRGQTWFNQGSSTLFLFASNIFTVTAVVPGSPTGGTWTISGNHTAVLTAGTKFAVYNNYGIAHAGIYPQTMVFQVAVGGATYNVGPDTTDIPVEPAPSLAPPFVDVAAGVPAEADDATPYGSLYVMSDWHEIGVPTPLAADGSCVAPSYSFLSDTTTGMFLNLGSSVTISYSNCASRVDVGSNVGVTTTAGHEYHRSGNFSVAGDAQTNLYVLRTATTNATLTEAFLDGTGGSVQMVLPNDTTWHFNVKIVARRTDVDGENAAFKVEGAITRNTNAASTAIVGSVTPTVIADTSLGVWIVTVDADTVNGALRVQVQGDVGKNISWVAFASTIEVTG